MSCEDCKKIKEQNLKGENRAYLQVGTGNVLVCACDRHFNQLRMMTGMDVGYNSPVDRIEQEE